MKPTKSAKAPTRATTNKTARSARKSSASKPHPAAAKRGKAGGGATVDYGAFRFHQRPTAKSGLVVFHASVKDILSWSTVGVLGPDEPGHQRERNDAKVRAISKFM